MRRVRLLAMGAVSAALPLAGLAQVEAPERPPLAPEPLYVAFAEEIGLRELMESWVLRLGIGIEFDPAALEGMVHLRAGPGVTQASFWATTNRVLLSKGLACVQVAGEDSLSVVPLDRAAEVARIEPEPGRAVAGFIKALVYTTHADANDLADPLAKVLAHQGSRITALPDSDRLLLAGLKPQVLEAIGVLSVLDAPEAASEVEEIPLRSGSPESVAALLERIAAAAKQVEPSGGLSGKVLASPESKSVLVVAPFAELPIWRELVQRFDRAAGAYTEHYAPERFGLRETRTLLEQVVGEQARGDPPRPWRVVSDELTGTLIITTTPELHGEVARLVTRLEGTETAERWSMRAIPVRHRRVADLLGLLEELLQGGALTDDAGAPAAPAPDAPPPTSAQATAVHKVATEHESLGKVTVTADEGANRLLAVGSARMLEQLAALVLELDVQHPQVLVETLILTLTEGETADLTAELQKLASDDGAQILLGSLFTESPLDPAAAAIPAAEGAGFTGVVLDPGSYSVVLRALETVNEGRTLSVPKVLVNNNEDATIGSVLQTPFTSVNASNTVTTTSFGGTVDAGTSVTVRPQIADGDRLILSYTVSLSAFTGEALDPTVPPPRQESRIESVVTIPDGHTVVVGGLEVESLTEGVSRTPVLGRIPLLGFFFRSTTETHTKTRFYVFLRCTVLRSPSFGDLRYLSAKDLASADIDDRWPVLEPRVIR